MQDKSIFTLRIEGAPGQRGIHDLRALLKTLLRRHGFRCIDAQEGWRSVAPPSQAQAPLSDSASHDC